MARKMLPFRQKLVVNYCTWREWEHVVLEASSISIFTLLPLCRYHKPRLKSFSSKAEGGINLLQCISGRKSVASMEPKNSECPIPTGWTLEHEVLKDGSKQLFYYCQGTGQQFYTYFELMRYVEYAKRVKVGIYSPNCKSLKRTKNETKDSTPSEPRKKSCLSIRRNPTSDSNSSTVDQISGMSSESESTDYGKDSDYMPESESSVHAESLISDAENEVNQVPNGERDDLGADNYASD